MTYKLIPIGGLAFSEEKDLKKLSDYAKKGWLLDSIVTGFFYKLRKDVPQNITYALDYQNAPSPEYFSLISVSGWQKVVSLGTIHIFSAPEGSTPLYTDRLSEQDKYVMMKAQTGKGALISFMIGIGLLIIMNFSTLQPPFLFMLVSLSFLGTLVVFIFNFMPWVMYTWRLRKMSEKN